MSAVVILAPIITPVIVGAGWPAIAAAVAGAATALGLVAKNTAQDQVKAAAEAQQEVENAVEVDVTQNEELAQNLATEEDIVLAKGNVTLRVRRDERGRVRVCASGKGRSNAELKALVEEFVQRMTQCFIYNRVMSEVKTRGFQVIAEQQMEDETVRVHLRRWEG